MKTYKLLLPALLATMLITGQGCKKDSSDEGSGTDQGTMDVRMTDAPGMYDKVLVDIQEVQVNIEGRGWVQLTSTRKGTYNLLDFNNGVDTLIASGKCAPGKVKQVKLKLGKHNHVVLAGVMTDLETSTTTESELTLNVNEEESIQSGSHYILVIDINADKSLLWSGGKCWFKPFMRYWIHHKTGSVIGDVNPDNVAYYAFAVPVKHESDTFETYLRSDGTFKLWGLKQAAYHIGLKSKAGVVLKTFDSVYVKAGQQNDLGTIVIP